MMLSIKYQIKINVSCNLINKLKLKVLPPDLQICLRIIYV